MELLMQVVSFLANEGSDILAGLLMVIGGLKIVAKYTPFKWDDDFLNIIDAPVRYLAGLLGKKEGK